MNFHPRMEIFLSFPCKNGSQAPQRNFSINEWIPRIVFYGRSTPMVMHDPQVAFQQSRLWHDFGIPWVVGLHWLREGQAGRCCCHWNFRVMLGFLFIFTVYKLRPVKPTANSCHHLLVTFPPSSSFSRLAVPGDMRILSACLLREIIQLWCDNISPMLWMQKLKRN